MQRETDTENLLADSSGNNEPMLAEDQNTTSPEIPSADSAVTTADNSGGNAHTSVQLRGQFFSSLSATFGGILVGLALGYTSTAVPSMRSDSSAPFISVFAVSLIGSAVPLGGLIGGLLAGPASLRIGRRQLLILLSLPALTGWLFVAYANSVGLIVCGRFFTGIYSGAVSNVVPTYVAEVCEPRVRGALGASFQLMVTVGVLVSYALGMCLSWRWLAVVGAAAPAVWLLLLAAAAVESPLWLVIHARDADAQRALLWLHGDSHTARLSIQMKLSALRIHSQLLSNDSSSSNTEYSPPRSPFAGCLQCLCPAVMRSCRLLWSQRNRRPLIMSLMLMFLQQLSGVNAVIFYTKDIFTAAGSHIDPGLATLLVGAIQVLATLASVLLVDRLGRRVLLTLSDSLMAVCLFAMGLFFYLKSHSVSQELGNSPTVFLLSCSSAVVDQLGWLPLTALLVYISAFSIGFGPIPWLMMGELFPADALASASAVATCTNWTLAFCVTLLFAPLQAALTAAGTFWLFGAVCVLGAVYSGCWVLETRGRSLQQIAAHFAS